ncbi:MAG: hypothetical protein INF56_16175 [Roseomonas sp.]|nr:hypothetical protein [Roseomonas sp.]
MADLSEVDIRFRGKRHGILLRLALAHSFFGADSNNLNNFLHHVIQEDGSSSQCGWRFRPREFGVAITYSGVRNDLVLRIANSASQGHEKFGGG